MSRDDLTEIPSFAARRDEAVDSAPRNAIPSRTRESAGLSGAVQFFLTLSFIAVCALSAYAWLRWISSFEDDATESSSNPIKNVTLPSTTS